MSSSIIFTLSHKIFIRQGVFFLDIQNETYKKYVKAHAPKSKVFTNTLKAFLSGGLICAVGQALKVLYASFGLEERDAFMAVSITFVFISAALTGLGIFPRIAKHTGGGTLVPITGFANSITSAAIDSKNEGWGRGMGAKIFTVAGPVLLYAVISGTVYGVIYFIGTLF